MERVGKEKMEEKRKQVGREKAADWKRKMKGMEEKSEGNGRERGGGWKTLRARKKGQKKEVNFLKGETVYATYLC